MFDSFAPPSRRLLAISLPVLLALWWLPQPAGAVPVFARQYEMTCNTCHVAFPRLNQFGEQFAGEMNMRLPNWMDRAKSFGDSELALPDPVPLAVRAQAFVQSREADAIDPISGAIEADADGDFQTPYLIKLISAAPLTEHISFYFYGILAEKGENGTVIIEDAWFSHDDLFGTGIGMQAGQFQVSDLMFPREQRLNFQDYMAYRFAGITYERGLMFGRDVGPLGIDVGFVNGNGISSSYTINSPGWRRPDHLFDNDDDKSAFARIGFDVGPARIGLFALDGKQLSATGPAGLESGERKTEKRVYGFDASGYAGGAKWFWYVQWLENRWDEFLLPGQPVDWSAGFAGADYKANEKWVFSALYNHGDAGDFASSDTVYEGIDMQTFTLTASYYFARNVKGVIELNVDLLDEEPQRGLYYTGHLDAEDYILIGFDAAY